MEHLQEAPATVSTYCSLGNKRTILTLSPAETLNPSSDSTHICVPICEQARRYEAHRGDRVNSLCLILKALVLHT
jgi:hypothetical protein